jgi:hypothetical protein
LLEVVQEVVTEVEEVELADIELHFQVVHN